MSLGSTGYDFYGRVVYNVQDRFLSFFGHMNGAINWDWYKRDTLGYISKIDSMTRINLFGYRYEGAYNRSGPVVGTDYHQPNPELKEVTPEEAKAIKGKEYRKANVKGIISYYYTRR